MPNLSAIALLLLLLVPTNGFYLPGLSPTDFAAGDVIPVQALKLSSPRSRLPYAYHSLPLCRAFGESGVTSGAMQPSVGLGALLSGDRPQPAPYVLKMAQPTACARVCAVNLADVPRRSLRALRARIRQGYAVRLTADDLPVVTRGRTRAGAPALQLGYRLGYVEKTAPARNPRVYVHNHLNLIVLYHRLQLTEKAFQDVLKRKGSDENGDLFRVVGFEVEPMSIAHEVDAGGAVSAASCERAVAAGTEITQQPLTPQPVSRNQTIAFTYSVRFRESTQPWATRWDPLLAPSEALRQIQWFSIVNSLMIGLFLTGLVATVLVRTVLHDFVKYQQAEDLGGTSVGVGLDPEDLDDVTGWKVLHGDVFRPPEYAAILSVLIASGVQITIMTTCTLALAILGFLSPANRGGLVSALLSMFVLASAAAGYTSARVYMSMEGTVSRRIVTMAVALTVPGCAFATFFLLNIALALSGSSGAVGFGTLLVLLFMWFGISVPLVFVGAFSGYRRKAESNPVRTNMIARQVPPPPCHSSPKMYIIPAGMLPFGTVFMELVFLLSSVNQGGLYHLYGALVVVFSILVVTCAEMSVVFTYLSLSCENWKWQWQAFLTTASSGIYVFFYALYYLFSQPSLPPGAAAPFMSWILYSSYMGLVSGGFALMCGSVGFLASQWFVTKIYSKIRVD